jgi:hypothetical protein
MKINKIEELLKKIEEVINMEPFVGVIKKGSDWVVTMIDEAGNVMNNTSLYQKYSDKAKAYGFAYAKAKEMGLDVYKSKK